MNTLTPRQIVAEAKASFGKPDSRFVAVQFDPKLLNKAIRHRVLCSFLDWLETEGLLAAEALERYCMIVKSVYDPEPVEEKPPQYAEDVQAEIDADSAEETPACADDALRFFA